MKTKIAIFLSVMLAVCACGGGAPQGGAASGGKNASGAKEADTPAAEATKTRRFPETVIPSVYGENTPEAREYVLHHYWDGFFKGEGETTPEAILGVADGDVEQALANFIQILQIMKNNSTPDNPEQFKMARDGVKRLFSHLEARQLADTTAKTYLRFTEIVAKYLYDPNSPMRDEDFYLPFVQGMVASSCTRDDMRNACRFEASQCSKNGFGQTVPNFNYKDARGNRGSLNAINAEYTMLFFSNPGCNSCKEIIDEIKACDIIDPMIFDKRLAIINIYIDEEVQRWREYLPNYPKEWINGYDYTFSLRDSGTYDIRAIPSLYLLDSKKRVLMKDAPTSNVLSYLENIYKQ